jgi:DNA primase
MENQVEEIKDKVDIVSIISERVVLKKSGSNFKGLCPFHSEKTPSFFVSPELQIFKCFGCGKSGDVFTFLEEYEGMEFVEALKFLAERAGVNLKPFAGSQKSAKERLYEVNSVVSNFYHFILTRHPSGKKALDYLMSDRKLTLDSIERFNLGFSPGVPLAMKSYVIERKGVSVPELVDAGIVYLSKGVAVDRFRDRIIFPLYDHRGNIVGFAGRVLPDNPNKDLAKYINTPETIVYKKSQLLYGLNQTRSEIKKSGFAVVVEGELDMISSYQAGIRNIVALKGSALTREQCRLLARLGKTVVLALDADFAGNEAARRGIFIAESEGLSVRVAELKGFKDPDEAAKNDPKELKRSIDEALGVWDFMIDYVFSKYGNIDGEQKKKVAGELIPLLARIENKITQSHYATVFAQRLGVPLEAVIEEIKKSNRATFDKDKGVELPEKEVDRRTLLEERCLGISIRIDRKILKKPEFANTFRSGIIKRLILEIGKMPLDIDLKEMSKRLPPELREKFFDIVFYNAFEDLDYDGLKKELKLVKDEIKILDVREEIGELERKIREYESSGDKESLSAAEEKLADLTKKLARFRSPK